MKTHSIQSEEISSTKLNSLNTINENQIKNNINNNLNYQNLKNNIQILKSEHD